MAERITGRFSLKGPCDNCPFRADKPFYLRAEHIESIADSLRRDNGTFSRHKHNDFDDETGEPIVGVKSRECAGMMATLEREDRATQLMRIAERLGMYDRTVLLDAPVYDSLDDWESAMLERAC